MDKQQQSRICREIGERTGGDIYIGVVGPVRSGKSTFIKRFMEELVLPAMGTDAARLRARDELPQSAAGRTIMTTEPKFIPEAAVPLQLEGGGACRVRLIDCVGYMVDGAMGHEENERPRMVKSPWFEEEVPFDQAAETGTRKVICDHSTIGIVVTTDGTVSDIPREGYVRAEKRVVEELEALGRPYVILLNSTHPDAPETKQLAAGMARDYRRTVLPVSCVDLDAAALGEILQLEQPEIVQQGGRYGVRLEACAPSIHMMKATIHTEISPIVGTERQSEELVHSLLADFEDDPVKLWQSNIFGKSLHELVNEGLQNKLLHIPQEARTQLQGTLEKVINDGCTGLICILI